MARARNIKPGFFMNDLLAGVEPLGRLLFVGLWTVADREGRLEDRPLRIKAEILPYDNCDVAELLDQLETGGFIQRYSVGDASYIQIINFTKHQNPHHREKESEIPPPLSTEVEPEESLGQVSGVVRRDLGKGGAGAREGASCPEQENPANTILAGGRERIEKALGETEESPKPAVLIPDSGYLIPDSGYPHPDSRAPAEHEKKPVDDDNTNKFLNQEITKSFSQTYGYPPNQTQLEMLTSFIDDGLPEELILEALKRSAEAGASSPTYTRAILQSWVSKAAYTLEDIHALDNLRKPSRRDGPEGETAVERLLREEIEREKSQVDIIDIAWAEGG